MRRACNVTVSDEDRLTLERWSRGRSTQIRLVTRARVVLAAAEGKENKEIAAELNISRGAVARWRDRFAGSSVAGINKDAPRGGRPSKGRLDLVRRIVEMTTQQKPASATHWSTRTLAEALPRHRHQGFIKFLKPIDAETPPGMEVSRCSCGVTVTMNQGRWKCE
jgi:transposase